MYNLIRTNKVFLYGRHSVVAAILGKSKFAVQAFEDSICGEYFLMKSQHILCVNGPLRARKLLSPSPPHKIFMVPIRIEKKTMKTH